MPTFNNIDLEESATVTKSVGSVTIARGSTNEEQEILCLGDPDTSNAIAAVTASAPASTRWGVNVRVVSGPSSVADFSVRSVLSSTSADNPVTNTPAAGSTQATRPLQSSAADLQMTATIGTNLQSTAVTVSNSSAVNVRVVGGVSSAADFAVTATPAAGSTFNVRPLQSSAADLQMTATPVAGSTWNVRPLQSSAADLQVTATIGANLQSSVTQNSNSSGIAVRVIDGASSAANFKTASWTFDSTGGGVIGSTTSQYGGVNGLSVRHISPTLLSTTVEITSTNSTAFYTLVDAAGVGLKNKVYAYFIGSTHTISSTGEFISSTSAPKWAVCFGSGSSGVTGANLAVTPPGFLFETAANTSLTFRVAGNSTAAATTVLRVSISYFQEA